MATATKKEEAYPWKAGASSGHTANLKQSILRLSIYMATTLIMTTLIMTRTRVITPEFLLRWE
jgi:hypothetical protein